MVEPRILEVNSINVNWFVCLQTVLLEILKVQIIYSINSDEPSHTF